MKALVVGANGLLGQNLLRAAPRGWELSGCGIEEAPLAPGLPADRWTRVDLSDLDAAERAVREADADVVFNAAAMTAVDACESEPERCARVNRDAVRAMARAAKRLPSTTFAPVASACMFFALSPSWLPPEVAKGITVLPVKSYCSINVSMMDGSRYHHTGKPTKTTSYCAMSATFDAIAGRHDLSFISIVLRLFFFVQSKSALV